MTKGRKGKMNELKKCITDNIVWIISLLVGIGIYMTIITNHDKQITVLDTEIKTDKTRIEQIEKTIVKLDYIKEDIIEIKSDIKEIKSVLSHKTEPIACDGSLVSKVIKP